MSDRRYPSVEGCFLSSPAAAPALRVAVVLERGYCPAYAAAVIESLSRAGFVRLTQRIEAPAVEPRAALGGGAYRRLIGLLERQYDVPDDPLKKVDGPPLLAVIPATAAPQDAPDVALDFTAHGARAWAGVARHGLWRLRTGNGEHDRGWPAYTREILEREAVSGIELVRIGARPEEDVVLSRAEFSMSLYPSARLNRVGPFWGARHGFLQKLWELHGFGPEFLRRRAQPFTSKRSPPADGNPSVAKTACWLGSEIWRRANRQFIKPTSGITWQIGLRRAAVPLYHDAGIDALRSFHWLVSPPGHCWADPFLFRRAGELWLFFEDIDEAAGYAGISCGRLAASGALEDVRSVLNIGSHLSYPQLLESDGEIFLLPESSAAGGVDLYRARRFPDEWTLEARLVDFPCVDSTVFRHAGAWWMFTSPMSAPSHAPITWVFRADTLRGPWRYFPSGPASQSALAARCAGEVIFDGGRAIRPSQDCGSEYGRALLFNEFTGVESDYVEREIARVEPGWKPRLLGVHTYNRLEDWEVIDGKFSV